MPPSTSQKPMVSQFVQLTGASERTAQRYLKMAGYKLNDAIDADELPWQPPPGLVSTSLLLSFRQPNWHQRGTSRTGLAAAQVPLICGDYDSLSKGVLSAKLHYRSFDRVCKWPDKRIAFFSSFASFSGPTAHVTTVISAATDAQDAGVYDKMRWQGVKNVLPSKSLNPWSSKRKKSTKAIANDFPSKEGNNSGYFSGGSSGTATPTTSALDGSLNQMFDKLRDDSKDGKDSLGVESTMAYLTDLGVNLENAEMLVVVELLQSPSVGEITRKGYVDGWKATGTASREAHVAHIKSLTKNLGTDPAYFRKVYRYTFVASKEDNQKALSVENAKVYWGVLFSPPGWQWNTKSQDWLQLWTSFLDEKWTRSVNRDMWNMTLEFATKTMTDETLSFWNEDGAWPSVIDDFVAWCKEKGVVNKAETMDLDA